MIKFEKVSYEQFKKDLLKIKPGLINYEDSIKELYNNVKLPKRSTIGSAGYDFVSPINVDLMGTSLIPTGIRAQMPQHIVLMMYPRSGLGFKTGVRLANSTGVIDSDYYYSDNEGHIMIKLVEGFADLHINAGDRIAQGIFMPYLIADDDDAVGVRKGGFGSTGK